MISSPRSACDDSSGRGARDAGRCPFWQLVDVCIRLCNNGSASRVRVVSDEAIRAGTAASPSRSMYAARYLVVRHARWIVEYARGSEHVAASLQTVAHPEGEQWDT